MVFGANTVEFWEKPDISERNLVASGVNSMVFWENIVVFQANPLIFKGRLCFGEIHWYLGHIH